MICQIKFLSIVAIVAMLGQSCKKEALSPGDLENSVANSLNGVGASVPRPVAKPQPTRDRLGSLKEAKPIKQGNTKSLTKPEIAAKRSEIKAKIREKQQEKASIELSKIGKLETIWTEIKKLVGETKFREVTASNEILQKALSKFNKSVDDQKALLRMTSVINDNNSVDFYIEKFDDIRRNGIESFEVLVNESAKLLPEVSAHTGNELDELMKGTRLSRVEENKLKFEISSLKEADRKLASEYDAALEK